MNEEDVKKIFVEIFKNGIVSFWKELSSTQKFAENYPVNFPLLVVAEKQTSSYGRRGSLWYSPYGGLWFTLSLNGNLLKYKDNLSVKVGEIIKEVLEKLTDLKFFLKEPNDIIYENKKVCGILITKKIYGEKERVHIGIGINVNNSPPIEESDSLINLTSKRFNLLVLLSEVLKSLKGNILK